MKMLFQRHVRMPQPEYARDFPVRSLTRAGFVSRPAKPELPVVDLEPEESSPFADRSSFPPGMRFTMDGDEALEDYLMHVCALVRDGVSELLPPNQLEAILLGGGYGRGEGGVLRTPSKDLPYNDMEFYVFMRGSTLWNERRYGRALADLGHELSSMAGIEVEFKLGSLAGLRRSPVTMFSYDLVTGHRWVLGYQAMLKGCGHHYRSESIPADEATRLLMNRCSGLLFAGECLNSPAFSSDDADFVLRNIEKARLALGDAVLAATGRYHWSCRERVQRLADIRPPSCWDWFEEVLEQHRKGMAFKLHPQPAHVPRAALEVEIDKLCRLSGRIWLWLESKRLHHDFKSFVQYVAEPGDKFPGTRRWRNLFVNLRTFGPRALIGHNRTRYPRERLLRTLPLLLWQTDTLNAKAVRRHLQRMLHTRTTDFAEYVDAYRRLWERFR